MRLTDTFVVGDSIIEVALADITTADVDVIVNSLCDRLHFGTGVSGTILYKGGHSIVEEIIKYESLSDHNPGSVLITDAGELPFKAIYHAISSSCSEGSSSEILKSCTQKCLDFARKRHVESIAFPALGTGEMGFDIKEAAEILIESVIHDCATIGGIKRIVFCLLRPDGFTSFFREAVKQNVRLEIRNKKTTSPSEVCRSFSDDCSINLKNCPPGWKNWRKYEDLAIGIFTELFVPPLSEPRTQERTENGLRVRDAIFPNYAEDGFWSIVDRRYGARFIVLECKNYKEPIEQEAVNQVSRYLRSGTLGRIGFIASRNEPSEQALEARREVFRDNNHIITFINDFDFVQMTELKRIENFPETYLQRKIEDFLIAY